MKLRYSLLLLCLFLFLIGPRLLRSQSTSASPEIKEQFDARMAWWRQARFGMFIHWDMSSIAGTEISWSRKGSRPLDGDRAGYVEDPVYDNLYHKFDPEKFNARQWVQIAKDAGMKYIVFTSKHHGGFAMWDTKMSDYSIMHTPFHRDVVKELADACHEAGMRFGIYYSPRDWHQPDYGIGDNRKYVDYMNGQVRELLSNYGKIDIIWWDSYGGGDLLKFWHEDETFDLVKKLQPEIVMNNRLTVLSGYDMQPEPYRGDFDTPEQRLGAFQNYRPWESCITISAAQTWSYRPNDSAKSLMECIHNLANCASGEGNLLLDVGPSPEGEIPAPQVERLTQIGAWMKKYGQSIYGTRGGPFSNTGSWGGSTYRGNTIYLHVFKWNGDSIQLPSLNSKVVKIVNLTDPQTVPVLKQDVGFWNLTLPADKQDPIDTIITLELSGAAEAEMKDGWPLPNVSAQADTGSLTLLPENAVIHGTAARIQNSHGISSIGYWTTAKDHVEWRAAINKPGIFIVKLSCACSADAANSPYSLTVGNQTLESKVPSSGSWDKYQEFIVGQVSIPKAGSVAVTLQPTGLIKDGIMNLEKLELDPK
jgi:alpha-L-fucosidase